MSEHEDLFAPVLLCDFCEEDVNEIFPIDDGDTWICGICLDDYTERQVELEMNRL